MRAILIIFFKKAHTFHEIVYYVRRDAELFYDKLTKNLANNVRKLRSKVMERALNIHQKLGILLSTGGLILLISFGIGYFFASNGMTHHHITSLGLVKFLAATVILMMLFYCMAFVVLKVAGDHMIWLSLAGMLLLSHYIYCVVMIYDVTNVHTPTISLLSICHYPFVISYCVLGIVRWAMLLKSPE
ncbi:hypothetical protein J7560_07655 [Wohlfahrtiimonas chitiniclastica]|nr:hypothetical protein [Wohlfahrtiimonas chitiniclastica]